MPGPSQPIDFVPAACEALNIANCLDAKVCKLDVLGPEAFGGPTAILPRGIDEIGTIQVSINDLNACIVAALQQAFLKANCPFPTLPLSPQPPDLSDCTQALEKMKDEALTPLGHLDDTFTLTLDENGIPTRIQSP